MSESAPGAVRNLALLLAVSACCAGIVEAVARQLVSNLPRFDYRSADAEGYGVFVAAPNQDLSVGPRWPLSR
jgi:hypothetical protein